MPPALVQHGTLRRAKVETLLQLHQVHSWIGLQGINGTGKSQLAALLCHNYPSFYWLELRNYNQDAEKTTLLIETFLSTITNCPIHPDRDRWISEVRCALKPQTLIVLNDLPKIEKNSALSELMFSLSKEQEASSIKLLSTSNHPISSLVLQMLNSHSYQEYTDLAFTDDEIVEYLTNNGADKSITKYLSLFVTMSQRNPQLVSAMVYHLKALSWGKNTEILLDALLNREFSIDILQDAQQSIGKFITDESTRELLYRISLIHWGIQLKEIITISEIEKKINHPNEKIQQLVNIWIQKQDSTYYVSPLIKDIGESNLSLETIQRVHLTIANAILSEKTLNIISASRCILSFTKGNDYNKAGNVLLSLYRMAETKEEVKTLEQWGLLFFWESTDIPAEMNIVLKALIRNEQIRLFQLSGKNSSDLQQWLVKYSTVEDLSAYEQIIICLLRLTNFDENDLDTFFQNLSFVFSHWQIVENAFQEYVSIKVFSDLIWLPIRQIVSEKEITQWLDIVNLIELKLQIDLFAMEIAQNAITVLSNRIANSQNDKPSEEKDWSSVLNRLEILYQFLNKRHQNVLATVVMKDIIHIEFVPLNNPAKAKDLTFLALGDNPSEEVQYLLYENLGKLYFNDNKFEQAKPWLLDALASNVTHQSTYIDTLIYSAAVVSKEDSHRAVEFCQKAVVLAENMQEFSELDYVQMLGELAIAYWINGEYESSYICFEKVITNLFELKGENPNANWIRLFSWTAHSLGYIGSSVLKEKTPQFAVDGSAYTIPYQGILSFNPKDLTDSYKPTSEPLILIQMAAFADGINSIQKTHYWSLKAFDLARKNNHPLNFFMVTALCSQYSIINFKAEEAFESQLLFSAVEAHLEYSTEEMEQKIGTLDSLTDIFSAKPSKKWNKAEETTILLAIIPLFISVLTAHLENKDDRTEWTGQYLRMIRNYIPKASNVTMWEVVLELCSRILLQSITEKELTERANTYGHEDRPHLQVICILGIIIHSQNHPNTVTQLLNILPDLTKLFTSTISIIKFVILPFVQNRCLYILKQTFVGSKIELQEIINVIRNVDVRDTHALQLILHPIVKEMGITMSRDRELWLNKFKGV